MKGLHFFMASKSEVELYTWWINLLSWLGIGLTVSGAIFGGIGIIVKNKKEALQKVAAAQNALALEDLRAKTEEARAAQKSSEAQTAKALVEVEHIKTKNLELQSQVEKEREGRLKIEERLKPRSISSSDQAVLLAAMKPLGPELLDWFTYPNDPEILGIANEIAGVLARAGWSFTFWQPLGGGNVSGMLVEVDPRSPVAMQKANTLVNTLRRFGLSIEGPIGSLPTPENKLPARVGGAPGQKVVAAIRLTVGRK